MVTYGLMIEMPLEADTMDIEHMPKDSAFKLIIDMQKRYRLGIYPDADNNLFYILFPKESERDFAYNELMNHKIDAIRLNRVFSTDEEDWDAERQKQIREQMAQAEKEMPIGAMSPRTLRRATRLLAKMTKLVAELDKLQGK